MKLLGLDLETNGLDVQKCAVVEFGAVLWDTDRQTPLYSLGCLVDDIASLTYGDWTVCEKLSGITKDDIDRYAENAVSVIAQYISMADEADFILAANGKKFDKLVMDAFLKRYATDVTTPTEYEWIDLYEFPFPETCKYRNLLYLAAYHGFINPFPHRALSDAMTMMKIAASFNMEEIVDRRNSPAVTLVARVKYANRAQAHERGFAWNGTKKLWYRVVRENELEALTSTLATYPFEVEFVEGDLS